jgi:bacterioferritin-associated ferredoxin
MEKRYADYDTDTLAHVDDSYYFGAFCGKCRHAARLRLSKLREVLGENCRLARIRERLVCERCGSRHVVTTLLAPNQMVGNLVELFKTQPRK